MKNEDISPDLAEEIEDMIDVLSKSGFFSTEEILEILEDEFIEEDVDFSRFNISLDDSDSVNFNKLEQAFNALAGKNVVAIHNCGYDLHEGVADAFELFVHLNNNKFSPDGFCFYTFEDVEEAIFDDRLKITFGDFENNEDKALEIGKIVNDALISQDFEIDWDGTVNNQIEINPFRWDKSYDGDKEYEMEGAYDSFVKNGC